MSARRFLNIAGICLNPKLPERNAHCLRLFARNQNAHPVTSNGSARAELPFHASVEPISRPL